MKMDMVKPMPANQLVPKSRGQVTPKGRPAMPVLTAIHEKSVMPSGLPSTSPAMRKSWDHWV